MLLSFGLHTNAQKGNLSASPTIGVSKPIFDSGLGFHIGVNPSYSLSSNFSIEGQLLSGDAVISEQWVDGFEGKKWIDAPTVNYSEIRLFIHLESKQK